MEYKLQNVANGFGIETIMVRKIKVRYRE